MNTMAAASAPSSVVNSLSDLDGYSLPSFAYISGFGGNEQEQDEFGFDPPSEKQCKQEHNYNSPPQDPNDPLSLSGWSSYERQGKESFQPSPGDMQQLSPDSYQGIDKIISQTLPNDGRTIARHGQLTPPRSNSASSDQSAQHYSPKTIAIPERKRRATIKAQVKEEIPQTTTTTGRKRKNSRKSTAAAVENPEEDDKRRQSLEKNRLAAAKCRINKKEKTEQLQRDSHDKAVHNAFLKEQVMRMKEEVQQMNAILLSHANCDGCMKPEEIQKHLAHLGTEFFSQRMSMSGPSYSEYHQMPIDEVSQMPHDMMQDDYFSPKSNNSNNPMLNPPLPEFDRSAEFEVQTPMQTD